MHLRFSKYKYTLVTVTLALLVLSQSCGKKEIYEVDPDDLTSVTYDPQSYAINRIEGFPEMVHPADNPLTVEGIFLGRKLFFDPILSADSTQACASCHLPGGSFTDNFAKSVGIDNIAGKRSSMSLLNVGYYNEGLFWDGREASLESQALLPVEDPIELHDTWPNVIEKLMRHEDYPFDFRRAFGIEDKGEITKELAAKALAQFERSIVSSGNSKYDRVVRKEAFFTDAEQNGFLMFFDAAVGILPDAECGHCHTAPLFTTNEYLNNGLDGVASVNDFVDKGRGAVTGVPFDQGTFRVPTLRNISFTAPYMHDGRFQTIEEVVEHYASGGNYADNRHPLITPLLLDENHKLDLIAFLKTLDDPDMISNPVYQSPF